MRQRLRPISSALAHLARRLPLPTHTCLGVEWVDGELRAARIEARAGGQPEVVDYAALRPPVTDVEMDTDLPAIGPLAELRERLGCRRGTPAVLATAMARLLPLSMNRERVLGMSRDALLEAAKWEAESYSGIAGQQALIGLEVEQPRVEPGQIIEDQDEILVQVAVLEQNVYRAIKERFRFAGLKLTRIYPSEVCFAIPLLLGEPEADRGVLDLGESASSFALLRGGDTLSINTLNISVAMIHDHLDGDPIPDLEETLRFNLAQAPAPLPMVVTGSGALDARALGYLRGLATHGAEPLTLARRSALTVAGAEEGARFATAAGAALRELGGRRQRQIGIDDSLPLALRVRRSIYLVPVAGTGLVFVLLLAHFLLMQQQEGHLRDRRLALEQQLDTRRVAQTESRALAERRDKVQADMLDRQRRIDYLRGGWNAPMADRLNLLQGLQALVPAGIALSALHERGGGLDLEGRAGSPQELMAFVVGLQQLDAIESVEISRLERHADSAGAGVPYTFALHLGGRGSGAQAH